MGLYHYTLRAETKTIDGIEIGRYGFAYKERFDALSSPRVCAMRSRGEDASFTNSKVRHFIMADSFKEACEEGYYVFQIDRCPSALVTETIRGAIVVGYIRKVGGRFVFRRQAPKMAA